MLKIHTADGRTTPVDLEDEETARTWLERLRDPAFQTSIRGVTVTHRGVQYSLPRPVGFDQIQFLPELVVPAPDQKIKGGERVHCQAGDVRLTMMVHREQRAARMTISRTGKQRYNPVTG